MNDKPLKNREWHLEHKDDGNTVSIVVKCKDSYDALMLIDLINKYIDEDGSLLLKINAGTERKPIA